MKTTTELKFKNGRYYTFSRMQVRWFPVSKLKAEAMLTDGSAELLTDGAKMFPTQSEQKAVTQAYSESLNAMLN